MVDVETWDSLSPEEQREFNRLLPDMVKAVVSSRAKDGSEFALIYRVEMKDQDFYIADGAEVLGEIRHKSKAVIETLFRDAAMNYGR